MRLFFILCVVSFVGNLASRPPNTQVDLLGMVWAAVASLLFFAPILVLIGAIPAWLFNRILAARGDHRGRLWRAGLATLLFGSAAIGIIGLLVIDGKSIGPHHAMFVVATVGVAALFGLVSESSFDRSMPQ